MPSKQSHWPLKYSLLTISSYLVPSWPSKIKPMKMLENPIPSIWIDVVIPIAVPMWADGTTNIIEGHMLAAKTWMEGELLLLKLSFLGSGPEGVDDLCFHTYGEFTPSSSSSSSSPSSPSPTLTQIQAFKPRSLPWGPNPSLEARTRSSQGFKIN